MCTEFWCLKIRYKWLNQIGPWNLRLTGAPLHLGLGLLIFEGVGNNCRHRYRFSSITVGHYGGGKKVIL